MNIDVFSDLKNYYTQIAKSLLTESEQAKILTNPSGVGTEREEVYRKLLERHLPKMCDVFLGGYVFDSNGTVSKQLDVIVTAGNTPVFQMDNWTHRIAPLEGTIGVAEVKSNLDKNELYRALENCAEIPRMPNPEGITHPLLKVGQPRWNDIPYKVILSYDAIEKETLYKHICEFYAQNKHIPLDRRPNLIHVLGKYVLVRIAFDVQVCNPDGTPITEHIKEGWYRWFGHRSEPMAIASSLHSIQHNSWIMNFSKFNYETWIDKIAESVMQDG